MRGRSDFDIIGRIGKITPLSGSLKVSVAADFPKKDKSGEWHNNTHWNSVTVFDEQTVKWVTSKLKPGDLVQTRGRVRQGSYEKDGETIYSVDLIAFELSLLASKEQLAGNQVQDEQHEAA